MLPFPNCRFREVGNVAFLDVLTRKHDTFFWARGRIRDFYMHTCRIFSKKCSYISPYRIQFSQLVYKSLISIQLEQIVVTMWNDLVLFFTACKSAYTDCKDILTLNILYIYISDIHANNYANVPTKWKPGLALHLVVWIVFIMCCLVLYN